MIGDQEAYSGALESFLTFTKHARLVRIFSLGYDLYLRLPAIWLIIIPMQCTYKLIYSFVVNHKALLPFRIAS
jgi:hypothetical protein